MMQYDHYQKKGRFFPNRSEKQIEGLDPETALGYLMRSTFNDIADVPTGYKQILNQGIMPFVSWTHKNIIREARYRINSFTGTGKARKIITMIGTTLLPYVAAEIYNNAEDDRRYAEKRQGRLSSRQHLILKVYRDLEDNDLPTRSLTWAMPNTTDAALEITGLSRLHEYIHAYQLGTMSMKEVATRWGSDVFPGVLNNAKNMLTPLIKIPMGLASGLDPYSFTPIVPEWAKSDPIAKANYEFGFVVRNLVSPVSMFLKSYYGSESVPFTEYIPELAKSTARLLGAMPKYNESESILEGLKNVGLHAGPFDLLGAMGFKMVDLQKNDLSLLNWKLNKISDENAKQIDDVIDGVFDGSIGTKYNTYEELLGASVANAVESGRMQLPQVNINGEMIEQDLPSFLAEMIGQTNRKITSDSYIKKIFQRNMTTLSQEEKYKLQSRIGQYMKIQAIKRLANKPEGQILQAIPAIIGTLERPKIEGEDALYEE
jgi:hypothetical protein